MSNQPDTNPDTVKDESRKARAAFVKLIKEENFYSDFSRWSLRAHWSGADGGFHDHQLQRRWLDFEKGWKAAKGINYL